MADRYWVGGTGTWDATNTANWSASSGGASGASVPTAADNVIFNGGSNIGTGAFTVTTGVSTRPCLNFTVTGLDGAMTFAGTIGVTVSASMTLPATNLTWTNTGNLTFNATTAQTITTNGVSIASNTTFSGVGGSWQLNSAFTTSSATVTLTSGTLNLNNYTLSASAFNSSGSTTRVLAFGTSGIVTAYGSGTVWNTATVTNFSYTGTSYVAITYAGTAACTINTGAMSNAQSLNFYISGAGSYTLTTTTGSAFNTLNFTGFTGTYAQAATNTTIYGNLVYASGMTLTTTSGIMTMAGTSGTKTITTNGKTITNNIAFNGSTSTNYRLSDNFTQTSTSSFSLTNGVLDIDSKTISVGILTLVTGTRSFVNGTLTCASVTHTSGDLTVGTLGATSRGLLTCTGTYTFTAGSITISGGVAANIGIFSSSNSNARSISFGTGSINITGSGTVWNTATVTNFSYTGTSNVRLTNAGSAAITITTGAMSSAQAQNFYITAGTYSLTLTTSGAVRDLNFTGFSGTYAQAATTTTVYGNLVFASTMSSTTSTGALNMAGTAQTITSNGDTIGCTIAVTTGTTTLADTFSQNANATLRVTNGNIDFNSQTYTLGTFEFGAGTGVPSNYGATLVCINLVQNRDLTVGSGGYNISTGTHTLTSGTLTIAASYTYSVQVFSSNNSNTRSIAFGSSSILELTGFGTVINFGTTTVTGFSYTGTSNVRLNYSGANTVTISTGNMTAAQAMNFYVIGGTHTVTHSTSATVNNLDFTGFSGTFAQAGGSNFWVYGNLVFSSTMSATGVGAVTGTLLMASTIGTKTITTNGITIGCNIYFSGAGGTTQLADSFTQSSGARFAITSTNIVDFNNQTNSIGQFYINTASPSYINYGGLLQPASVYQNSGTVTVGTGALISTTGNYELVNGTITINNGVNLSVGSFSSPYTSARTLAFGTGSITTTGTGVVWAVTGATGLTVTGTSNVIIDNPTATAVSLTNTSASAANAISFYFINGTYALSLTSGNSYNILSFAGYTGTVAFNNSTHTMYGNLILGSGMTSSATVGTNTLTWSSSTSNTATITSNGATAGFGIRLNGAGQTIQLLDAFVQDPTQLFSYTVGVFDLNNYSASVGVFTITTGTHSFTNGTLNCATVTHTSGDLTTGSTNLLICSGTYTFTAGSITINNSVTLSVGVFSSSNTGVRSIAFGTGSITITGNATTVWTTSTSTNLTSTGTPYLSFTYAGSVGTRLIINGTASANWAFVFTGGTDTVSISGGTYGNLDVTAYTGTLSFTGTVTITSSTLTVPNTVTNGSGGGVLSFTAATVTYTPSTTGTAAHGVTVSSTTTLTLGANFSTTNALNLNSGAASSAIFNMNSKTISVGTLTVGSNSSTHVSVAIQNGTLNCVAFVQAAAISIGTGYNIVSTGNYSCNYGQLTINDGVQFVAGTFISNTTTAGIVKGIAFGTGSMRLTGTADANETILTTVTGTSLFSFTGSKNVIIDNTLASSIRTGTINTVGLTTTQALNFNVISGSHTLSFTSASVLNDLSFGSSYTGTWDLGSNSYIIYGSLTLGANSTLSSVGAIVTWSATSGTDVITTNGKTIPFNIVLNGVGQTVQLSDNFNQTGTFTLTNGTFDMNSKTAQTSTFIILTGTHAIANGTLNCTTVTHTSGALVVGSGYNVVCSGTYTLTVGSITINDNVALKMGAFSSNNSNVRSIAFGTSGSIEITGKSTTVWLVNPAGLTHTGTSLIQLTATGTGTTTTINTGSGAQSNALRFAVTAGSYPITTASGAGFRGIDFTGYSGTWTISTSINNYGNIVLSNTMSFASTGTITFQTGTFDASFTSNGKTIPYALSLNNTGTITFTDDFNSSSSVTVSASAILTAATTNVTASSFTINGTVNMGSGIWTATGFGTVWSAAVGSTINADTSTLDFTAATSKTFSGGGKTYYSVRQNGFGTLTISGSNTFYSISSPYNLSDTTILFTAGSTQTITGSYDLSAVLPNIITVKTTSSGSTATISKSSGTVNVYRATIQDITATGGATWNAYTTNGNTDGGGNSGWNFGAIVAAAIGAFFAFF